MFRKSQKTAPYATFNNRKYKIPPPEDISEGQICSFTFNPVVQPQLPNYSLNLVSWHNGMDNIFKGCKYAQIKAYVELSSGGRFHYHGTIEIRNVLKFFIFDLPLLKAQGSYEIDHINDLVKWLTYCTKQEGKMKSLTKEYGIPYHYDGSKPMKLKINPLNDTPLSEFIKIPDYDSEPEDYSPSGETTHSS